MSKLHLTSKETGLREMVDLDLVPNYFELYVGPEGEELVAPKKSKKETE